MLSNGKPVPKPSAKYKLLIVGSFPPPDSKIHGGIAASCKRLLESELADKMELILLDSTQRSVPPPPLWARAAYALPRMLEFLKLFHGQRPDALLLFAPVGMGFLEKAAYAIYARLYGVPSLMFPRGGSLMTRCRTSRAYFYLVKHLLRAPRYLLCQGESWQSFFVDEMGMSPERCPVIKNWTAPSEMLSFGAERTYGKTQDTTILFMGWLDREKGVMELIQAVERLWREFPEVRLVLAGEGNCTTVAREWVRQHQCESAIQFAGWVHGEEKLKLFKSADIFCLPSYAEGLPNAMVEAMAAGLPVVMTPVGVISDVVIHGENGLLARPADVDDLEQKLHTYLENRELSATLGRNGYATAQRDFSLENAARNLYRLSMQAISEKHGRISDESSRLQR